MKNLCQQDPKQFTVTATGSSSSSERPEVTGASSSSEQPEATDGKPLAVCEEEVHLQANDDGERYIRKFDDPAKSLKPQNQEGTRIAHTSGNYLPTTDLRHLPFFLAVWSQFASDCLWTSF